MSFLSVVKVELIKLYHKRITLLLLLFFIPSILFGAGMAFGFSFFVSDGGGGGVDAVGKSMSGIRFAVNMLEQSKYIIFLVIIILAAVSLSGELENGQIKSEITRVCSRCRIFAAKYTALLVIVYGIIAAVILWSLLIYMFFVNNTSFASGRLYDEFLWNHISYVLFVMLGIAFSMAVTFFLGTMLKTFPCFAISYIFWFMSLYSDFIKKLKLLFPCNMPAYLLENAGSGFNSLPYGVLYFCYCVCFIICGCVIFKARDIKF